MKNKKLNFENFKSNTLSKKEQKTVRGGDDSNTPSIQLPVIQVEEMERDLINH
ncbi:TIGR04149 family rSAM-modified RiPP [Flavobacterium sp. B183]|uniref:TIGR04149 family rSAM-modified RiPP n=1 Tax=Flavobacterium sp. B183 TaxID=907046 RepID=UPI00201F3589|nr:TIGR04149 family rSAM-modified RiPP [Flavobacterium sp. B183]URC13918.1 TIGR04149 family rSAM-modified RiPP [Flavobacterium sp. B183]